VAGTPAAVDAGPGLRSRSAKGSALGWAILGLLVLLLAFELIALTRNSGGAPSASAADVGIARQFAVAVTSFDHKRLDADVQRVLDLGTPGFEREFRSAMGPNFTDRIAANKTVSSGEIVAGPRVQTVRGGAATFFVVLDQTVTSEGSQAQPQLVRVGLLVKVQEKDHKVASVQVL
jgi:Mce-associated membrane protein